MRGACSYLYGYSSTARQPVRRRGSADPGLHRLSRELLPHWVGKQNFTLFATGLSARKPPSTLEISFGPLYKPRDQHVAMASFVSHCFSVCALVLSLILGSIPRPVCQFDDPGSGIRCILGLNYRHDLLIPT